MDEIKKDQVLHGEFCETHLNLDAENKFCRRFEDPVYVPDKNELRERICVIAHVGMTRSEGSIGEVLTKFWKLSLNGCMLWSISSLEKLRLLTSFAFDTTQTLVLKLLRKSKTRFYLMSQSLWEKLRKSFKLENEEDLAVRDSLGCIQRYNLRGYTKCLLRKSTNGVNFCNL
jgi:hypothetical protein